jgi:microcystin-dependent protein
MYDIFFTGQIVLLPYLNYLPAGSVPCDGRSLSINEYQPLYSLIGLKYGGNSNSFNVPDLRNASPIPGANYYIVTQGIYPERS